jgi:hypothetical protein
MKTLVMVRELEMIIKADKTDENSLSVGRSDGDEHIRVLLCLCRHFFKYIYTFLNMRIRTEHIMYLFS